MRISLAAAAAAAALVACSATLAAPSASPPRCHSGGLVVWLDTNGSGAAGSIYYELRFTNQSGRTCMMLGYPGVSAIDLRGRQLGKPARREPTFAARPVTLHPNATARVILRITNVDNYPQSVCGQTAAAGLRVYPPGETAAKLIPFPFRACSRSGAVYLSIRPVEK